MGLGASEEGKGLRMKWSERSATRPKVSTVIQRISRQLNRRLSRPMTAIPTGSPSSSACCVIAGNSNTHEPVTGGHTQELRWNSTADAETKTTCWCLLGLPLLVFFHPLLSFFFFSNTLSVVSIKKQRHPTQGYFDAVPGFPCISVLCRRQDVTASVCMFMLRSEQLTQVSLQSQGAVLSPLRATDGKHREWRLQHNKYSGLALFLHTSLNMCGE